MDAVYRHIRQEDTASGSLRCLWGTKNGGVDCAGITRPYMNISLCEVHIDCVEMDGGCPPWLEDILEWKTNA